MSLAFWNNPIVVSAFRVKYRRGMPLQSASAYLVLLAVGGAVLQYYNHRIGGPWARNYYFMLMGLQFIVSGLIAVSATSVSMRSEVTNRTLDFQRVAALSPRAILLGKLLGEPATAFFLAMATVPLAVLCWLGGGVDLEILLLVYVNLATTTLLFAALGLLNRLELPASKGGGGTGTGNPQVVVIFFLVLFFNASVMVFASGMALLAVPWAVALIGLPTPLPALYGIVAGDPWRYGLAFFDREIPFLFVTPVAQVALAFLCFQAMARQLLNPLNPPFSKRLAYLVLIVVDVLMAGVLFDSGPLKMPPEQRGAAFCLAHLLASMWLTVCVTPWKETLHSWVWRFRGRQSWLRDAWLGNRSENGVALATFCAIGAVNLVLLVLLPAAWQGGAGPVADAAGVVFSVLAATIVLILALGTLLQWILLLAGRGGTALLFTFVPLLVAAPHIVGAYYQWDAVLALSPSAHFARWLGSGPVEPLNVLPLLVFYGCFWALLWLSLRRRMGHLEKVVDAKLKEMGVPQA